MINADVFRIDKLDCDMKHPTNLLDVSPQWRITLARYNLVKSE
jgi:hypothetical protein